MPDPARRRCNVAWTVSRRTSKSLVAVTAIRAANVPLMSGTATLLASTLTQAVEVRDATASRLCQRSLIHRNSVARGPLPREMTSALETTSYKRSTLRVVAPHRRHAAGNVLHG